VENLFLDVLNLSITAGWLIAAVLLVRLVIRKRAPKWICCLLWGMVGLRLVLPFSLESALSLVPSRETVIPESVYGEVALPVTPPENHEPVVPPTVPDDNVPDDNVPDMPVINTYPEEYIHSGIGIIDNKVNPIIQSTATVTENGKETNILQTVTKIGSIVWVCGMAALAAYAVINYLLLKKRISFSVPEGKDIRKSEAVGSPFILGFFRPRIYLPFGLSAETEAHVIAHERAHLKRKDHWIKPIGYAVLTLHWFNPLVWAAYILLCRDIEYACDEKVVKNMSAEARKAYAEALLECGVSRSMIAACPVAFGEIGVKTRVKNALNYKKPLFWVMILAVVICAAVAVLFLTSPAAKDNETSENVSEEISEEVSETSKDEITKIIPPAFGDTDPLDFNLWYGLEDVIAKHITLDERIEAIKRSESKAAFCIVELTELNFVEDENDYSNSYVDLKFRIVKTIAKSSSWDLEENQEVSSFQQFVYWRDVDGVTEVRYIEDFPPPFLVCGSYYGVAINDGQVPKDSPEGYDVSVTNLTIPLNDKSINDTEYRNKLYKELQMAPGNQGGFYEVCETIIDRYFEKAPVSKPETSEDEVSEDAHAHSFGDIWFRNINAHWQVCECGQKGNSANHSYTQWEKLNETVQQRYCTVCKVYECEEITIDYSDREDVTLGIIEDNEWYSQEELDGVLISYGLHMQKQTKYHSGRNVDSYYGFEEHFADALLEPLGLYGKYDRMFRNTETAALGHLLEYYGISFEEYIGFYKGNEYARIMGLGQYRKYLPENMPVYASVYPKFHREAWYREDFWNHEDFKTYAELANPDEIQDYYTSLADRGGYTKYYYIIDRILIEHVGVDAFNAWLDSVGDKDQNIVKFIEYFEITREVYNSLCANHNITPYNPDYLFGTPEMQDEYFKVHPLDLDHLHRAI